MPHDPSRWKDGFYLWGKLIPRYSLNEVIFGNPGPGVGMMRSVVLFLDGRSGDAILMHPSAIWVSIWLLLQVVIRLTLVFSAVLIPRYFWIGDLSISMLGFAVATYIPIIY